MNNSIKFAEIKTSTIKKAHEMLGALVNRPLKKILEKKLNKVSKKRFIEQILFVKKCGHFMKSTVSNPNINRQVKKNLDQYFVCLSSWGKGAQLESFKHPILQSLKTDGISISPEDLALWLQNDNLRCQTGMIRMKQDKVIFWHTEEDTTGYINGALVASLKTHHEHLSFFVYPHLLPGSTFSWSKDFFMAVDSLPIKCLKKHPSSLANITSWLVWRLANKLSPRKIIKLFSPHLDGYTISLIRRNSGKIIGEKIEFGGNTILKNILANHSYTFLFQTNIVSNPKSILAKKYQKISSKSKDQLQQRMKRTQVFLKSMKNKVNVKKIFKMLTNRQGQNYAYANKGVKAHLIGQISNKKMELWLGKGQARKEEFLQHITVDRI